MSKPLPRSLVVTFSVCFLTGIFGGLLAPAPYNVAAGLLGLLSFALLLPIGRRVDTQKEKQYASSKQWRIAIKTIEALLVLMVGVALWTAYLFIHYRRIDLGLAGEVVLGTGVIIFLRSVATKRLHAAENEQKG